ACPGAHAHAGAAHARPGWKSQWRSTWKWKWRWKWKWGGARRGVISASAADLAGRGQRGQPDAGGPPAAASRARGDRGRGRIAGAGRVRCRAVRRDPDGRADAEPRRLRGDRVDPPARA